MIRTLLSKIRSTQLRLSYSKKGIIVASNTKLANVNFCGTATISEFCRLIGDPEISIGNNFYANVDCHFLGDISIGNDVLIGPKTIIWGRDHGIKKDIPIREQPHNKEPIKIGNDVWIGAGVTILKGIEIADGAVIGAGSIVTKSIPKNAIAVGNPAKVLSYRE